MDNIIHHSKSALVALVFLASTPVSAVYAEDNASSSSSGHWYLGATTGYLAPDTGRDAGNTRTVGADVGYQFNDRWSVEAGYQSSAGRYNVGPWGARVRMHDLQFIRYWGDKYRVLAEFGYTHISMDASSPDDTSAGFHIGAGLSTFVTKNVEIRGDAKGVFSPNQAYFDAVGTLSLNWHFVDVHAAAEEQGSALGESTEQTQALPPVTYREEPAAVEAAPAPAEAAAPVVAAPVEAPAAPVVDAPAPVEAAAPAVQPPETAGFVSPTAVPKTTHTLLNFGAGSIDVHNQYGSQLDQLSQEIKSGDSKAVIEGHTDSVGSSESNKVLSLDRAITVKRELKNRGVSGDKLRAVGMGEEQPVATNDTAEGRAKNRRVEVKIYDNK